MSVVGLDQSYTGFGYCVDGVAKKKGFPASKYVDDVHRLASIREWLETWLETLSPVPFVVMEGYSPGSKFGREMAGELGGVVKLAVYDTVGHDRLLVVPPTSLKKFVTGRGNAKKNEMLLGVYKQWGETFTDDNQADAFSLEKFGHAAIDAFAWPKLPKYQQEALAKVNRGPLAK